MATAAVIFINEIDGFFSWDIVGGICHPETMLICSCVLCALLYHKTKSKVNCLGSKAGSLFRKKV